MHLCVCVYVCVRPFTQYDAVLSRYLVDSPAMSCAVIGPEAKELSSDWTVKVFDL